MLKTPDRELFDQPAEVIDPLHLDLEDKELVNTIKDNIRGSMEFYKELDLYARQQKNREYYLGRQPLYKASNKSQPYKENIIYEGISRQKPIELSRMPDLTVKPGDDNPDSKERAKDLSGIFNNDTKRRANRKLLGLAIKQEPIYFYAVIKAIWNPEKGPFGDYEFVNVHPDNIVWDQNTTDNDTSKMRFVSEKSKLMLKEVIMMFPDKEDEIKKEFGWTESGKGEEEKLASPVNVWESWFHWYELKGSESERIDGVVWIYGNLLLKKMKNPYFDYQGKRKTFSMVMEEKDSYSMDDIFNMIDVQKGEEEPEVIYNNYFQDPEKPYFFMVYENMGEQPIGATSRVEQILEFQDNINQDGSIIQDMNIRSRGKDLISTDAIPQDTLDKMDFYNVDEVVGLDIPQGSSMSNIHGRIEQKPATAQQYKSLDTNRQKGFEMLGVGQENRGLADPNATLGQSQMAKEGDFSLIDDIVEDTINAVAEWQAKWSMQFIKLFYTKPHMRHILGKDGEVLHTKLTQDMVDDGMEVVVSASGVDKMQRRRMATQNMELGVGNPLDYFVDTEQAQPRERALKAMLAQGSPMLYIEQYLQDKPTPGGPAVQQAMGAMPGAEQQPPPPVEGQPPGPPAPPGQGPPVGGGGQGWNWHSAPRRQ